MLIGEHARARARLGETLDLVLAAAPVIFAIPVLYGLGASLLDLAGTGHPYFRDASGINFDGLAIRLGEPLYQDPAAGYTPGAYTPLMPLIAAGLDLVKTWSGWTLLVSIASALGLMAVTAWLAYAPRSGRPAGRVAALAGAVGMAGLAFWLVAFVPFNFLYVGRSDQLAWALGLAGLVLVPGAVRGSTRAGVAVLILLSLSFWAKQTGAVAAGVGLVWMLLSAARGVCPWRRAAWFCLVFVAANGAVWLVLDVFTAGWSVTFVADLPRRHGNSIGFGVSLGRLLKDVAAPVLLVAVLWLPILWRARQDGESLAKGLNESARRRLAVVGPLVLFAIVSVPLAARFGQARGSSDNQYVGLAWALGLIAAVGYGLDQRRRRSALVAAVAVVALFAVTESSAVVDGLDPHRIFVPVKSPRAYVAEEPSALRTLAARRPVYHPVYADVSAEAGRALYPTDSNIYGLYAAGTQPAYLVDALLQRRFDVVYAFQDRGSDNGFGADRLEDQYTWKLDEVIRRKYRLAHVSRALDAARTVPAELGNYVSPGVYVRRPGPDPAPWLRDCFGPFRLASATWDIRSGGGLWCRLPRHGQTLRLVSTPSLATEVRSRGRGRPEGVVGVDVAGPGAWAELASAGGGSGWTVRVQRAGAGAASVVTLTVGGRPRGTVRPRAGAVRLEFRTAPSSGLRPVAGGVLASVPPGPTHLLLRASVTSAARFDLAGLRLR